MFGLSNLKFERSSAKTHLYKVSFKGVGISLRELKEIVSKIELIFTLAQESGYNPDSSDRLGMRQDDMVNVQESGVNQTPLFRQSIPLWGNLLNRPDERARLMLNEMIHIFDTKAEHFLVEKKPHDTMKVLDIQDYLSRKYHFLKWVLVELLEAEERELTSYSSIKKFSELVNGIRTQMGDMAVNISQKRGSRVTVNEIVQAIDQLHMQCNQNNLYEAMRE